MSIDSMLREMVREEVRKLMTPVMGTLANLEARQREVVSRLAQVFHATRGGGKRGPAKLAKDFLALAGKRRGGKGSRGASGDSSSQSRACAIEGCSRPARSKGYCAAHYQKFRMLERTNRLPDDWVANAPAGTVKNVVLPRGRAGAKALAASKRRGSSSS